MTVKSDLQKATAMCEELKGIYAMAAESTDEQEAKQVFKSLKEELDKHISFLTNRVDYLTLNNPLNQEHINNALHPKNL